MGQTMLENNLLLVVFFLLSLNSAIWSFMFKLPLKTLFLFAIGFLVASCSSEPIPGFGAKKTYQLANVSSNRVALSLCDYSFAL